MGVKYIVGTAINDAIEALIRWKHTTVPFIPNGRILTLDLKRAAINPQTIFDIGANEGQTARYYARHFKNATIYAFEPVSSAYEKMIAHTPNPRIRYFNQALGNAKGQSLIYKAKDYTGISSINGINNDNLSDTETVQITTGLDVCKEYQISSIDLLKIDTEGYEINVLDGFKPMLKTGVKFIYIETSFDINNTCQTYITKLLDYLYPLGFIVSGFYGPHRKGFGKLKLDHCDLLLTNTGLINL